MSLKAVFILLLLCYVLELFLIDFFLRLFLWMSVCMYVYVPCLYLVPIEGGRGFGCLGIGVTDDC